MGMMLVFSIIPAFGEVTKLSTNTESYLFGDNITFEGKVANGDTGIVTIVIRDSENNFVLLSQAIPESDYSFKKTIKINEKFTNSGIYNATGFIVNMTAGITTEFGISANDTTFTEEPRKEQTLTEKYTKTTPIIEEDIIIESKEPDFVDPQKDPKYYVDRYYNEPEYKSWFDRNYPDYTIEEAVGYDMQEKELADFVDPQKDPKYYVDRYYNEPEYKSWFDRNYPDYTIEEAVGYDMQEKELETAVEELINKEIIPKAEASSIVKPSSKADDNSDTAQIILAIGGLGILFGAVYGVKKKVDDNSKQISINKDTIRKRIINPLMGNNPYDILQTRLAKGEITLEEFDMLERKLNKKY
ncbi:SHOCT domain-containing protein [Nitrosopumilus sp. K4]|nr:SHOCT domain-containing protein [Nitrosopumilus sp. K4]